MPPICCANCGCHETRGGLLLCAECGVPMKPDFDELQSTIQQLERRLAMIEDRHRRTIDVNGEASGRRPTVPRPGNGQCLYAGPGRGDCENFVGLPGHSIPGQHDGDDDTVDVYGKPNGWCWHCWLMRERDRAFREAEQLRVQLAGCLTAAEGGTSDPAVQGMYGWSLAYQRTLELRLKCNALEEQSVRDAVEETLADGLADGEKPRSVWDRVGEDE